MIKDKSPSIWQQAPIHLDLSADEIHLWRASVGVILPEVRLADLSPAEKEKAGTLKNEGVRAQFLVSHWVTRQILARYRQVSPARLQFAFSDTGKPCLIGGESGLEFNRSHSGGWFVLAVAAGVSVGVDIEEIRARAQMRAIAERWFEPSERDFFEKLPEAERSLFFYECWTQKEAVLKAWGVGLGQLADYSRYEKSSWRCHFKPVTGFAGCVALPGGESKSPLFFSYPASA